MKRFAVLVYGLVAYLAFLGSFLYLIGFVGDLYVPKSLEGVPSIPLWQAVFVNISLIALFGLQHSIMARSWFKKWWLQYIPTAIERSTFALLTAVVLVVLFYFWQPMGGIVWSTDNKLLSTVLMVLFASGWVIVLASSFLINHFDLFGLRQVWLYFQGRPYTDLEFDTPYLYKLVRHPLYFGILLAFWCTPYMSASRLLFAIVFTVYVLRAIRWEENDLISLFGEKYKAYKKRVPMILPSLFSKKSVVKK